MQRVHATTKCALALALAGLLAIGPALAEKGGKSDKGQRADKHDSQKGARGDADGGSARGNSGHSDSSQSGRNERADRPDHQNPARGDSVPAAARRDHFDDRHRVFANNYYSDQFRSGRCPPGLAKKHNGCLPPGQAKKWNVGQPLPQGVTWYPVPQSLVTQFGHPPAGYRYVRVGSDIVLMQTASRTVVDVIRNLGRS